MTETFETTHNSSTNNKSEPQEVINELKNNSPNGIGTVYLITLLFFISRGEYPIYDRFVKIAIA